MEKPPHLDRSTGRSFPLSSAERLSAYYDLVRTCMTDAWLLYELRQGREHRRDGEEPLSLPELLVRHFFSVHAVELRRSDSAVVEWGQLAGPECYFLSAARWSTAVRRILWKGTAFPRSVDPEDKAVRKAIAQWDEQRAVLSRVVAIDIHAALHGLRREQAWAGELARLSFAQKTSAIAGGAGVGSWEVCVEGNPRTAGTHVAVLAAVVGCEVVECIPSLWKPANYLDLKFDEGRRTVRRGTNIAPCDEEQLWSLFVHFMKRRDTWQAADELERLWDSRPTRNALEKAISTLRNRLRHLGITVRNKRLTGYRLELLEPPSSDGPGRKRAKRRQSPRSKSRRITPPGRARRPR